MKLTIFRNETKNAGFTLVELMVSIGLMSLMAGYFIYNRLEALKLDLAQNIAQEALSISNLVARYESENNNWPGGAGCGGAVAELIKEKYLPDGYNPISSATFNTTCTGSVPVSESFQLDIAFSSVDEDLADIVGSALPLSVIDKSLVATSSLIYVRKVITSPRRNGRRYKFIKQELKNAGRFRVEKPICNVGTPQYIAYPQALCNLDDNGIQGYYVEVESFTSTDWNLRLHVGSLCNSSSCSTPAITYNPQAKECNSKTVEIGVVTYCE